MQATCMSRPMMALQQPPVALRAAAGSRAPAPARPNLSPSHAAGSKQPRSKAASLVVRAAISGVRAAAVWLG
jgi:hypothetical protein